jgi:PAS domain S-box-containing protein
MAKTRRVESKGSSQKAGWAEHSEPHGRAPSIFQLRKSAEELLSTHISDLEAPSPEEVQQLVYELEVHRIELEMQNEELREAQQALEASRDRYADLYDFAPLGYVSLDQHGRIREINLAAAKLLCRERSRLTGRPLVAYVAVEDKNAFLKHVRKCFRGQEEVTSEVSLAGKGGQSITVQLHSIPVADTSSEVTLCRMAVTDITASKRIEAEREKLIADLEASNAELERFTYTVSHDLKSPLFTIMGFLGMLEQHAAEGNTERMKEEIAQITSAAEKMERLLGELLEVSRIGRIPNPPEEVALGELAREAVDLLAGQIAQRGVQVEVSPELPVVFGDRPRLLEVLQNLVDNAVKFMGEQPKPRIEIGVRQRGERADETVCYVRDNGVGIDPVYHEKVFGLFDQLDPHNDGTGVGLALVKRVVEVHGGRIWVESEGQGQGCTFCFALPRKGESVANEQRDSETGALSDLAH